MRGARLLASHGLARFLPTVQEVLSNGTSSIRQLGQLGAAHTAAAVQRSLPVHSTAAFAAASTAVAIALLSTSDCQAENDVYSIPSASSGSLPQQVVLYQYEVCPFCCKVKAFLDYHKIPYSCVEVNPLSKSELKWSDYKKVPVLFADGQQYNDSSLIISQMEGELRAQQAAQQSKAASGSWWRALAPGRHPAAAGQQQGMSAEEEATWRRWVDERLVRIITVNIYRSAGEAWQTFNYITENGNFSWVERQASRVAGSTMMWAISGRLKKKYEIEGDLRQRLYEAVDQWVQALGPRDFAGGRKPNLADLAVFGVMRSVVGTDTFRDMMLHTSVAPWYERMVKAVGDSSRVPHEST